LVSTQIDSASLRPKSQRRVSDADNEGIAAGPGFRNDFDVLTAAEAELQQTANQGSEASGS